MFPLIYYINLDERIDRKELAIKEFEKLGIKAKRFSAIKDENPAVGCWKSHIYILREAQRLHKNVLIFEDDVEFVDGAKDIIEKALDELAEIDFDGFYLGGNVLRDIYQVTEHLGRLNHCQSTHAISFNHLFLDKLIPFLESNRYIIDVLLADYVIPNSNFYITIPMTAIQRTSYSNIEKQVMTYDIPIARFNQHLKRKSL